MINYDKLLHLLAGFLIGFFSMVFFEKTIVSMFFVCSAAYLKEAYDERSSKHTADAMDIVATIVGGLVATILFLRV